MSSQKKAGWGSIFSGAVANLESRLDTILAEDSEASARERAAEQAAKPSQLAPPGGTSGSESRDVSRSRVNDRLAERLAKATQARPPSRTSTPINDADSVRTSGDAKRSAELSRFAPNVESERVVERTAETVQDTVEATKDTGIVNTSGGSAGKPLPAEVGTLLSSRLPINPARISIDSSRPSTDMTCDGLPSSRPSIDIPNGNGTPSRTVFELQADMEQMRSDHAEAESQRQEEMHIYLERIDALQAKLTYLAKETVAAAKEANASASSSSEQQLAEKDERIASLMQEGHNLSKTEMRHLQTIKKLRAKGTEDERAAVELRRKIERTERSETELKARLRRAEVAERQASEKAKQIAAIGKEVEELRQDRENASELILDLTVQLKEAKESATQAEHEAKTKATEVDRGRIASLENDLEDAQIEKKLAEDRAVAEVKKIREEAERDRERFSMRELELKGEISGLESRFETVRARAEEASTTTASGAEDESHVKLLRQVETLQQQYALAQSNWETIEGSLTARVATMEKERDEVNRRDVELRKKTRDLSTRTRTLEDDYERSQDHIKSLERELQGHQEQAASAQARLQQSESTHADSKSELDRQRKLLESEFSQRLEEEKLKWRREMSGSPRHDMPPTFSRKGSGLDSANSHSRKPASRHVSHELSSLHIDPRNMGRRGSGMPSRQATPVDNSPGLSRRESTLSLEMQNNMPPTPSIEVGNHPSEDFDDQSFSERTINDLFSSSTAGPGVGPSVQLVERMSALVRKLESEKATFRDELQRLSAQRDDARNEVVELMREVEAKRNQEGKLAGVEKGMSDLSSRYEASLEMLGEREEEVEELKMDVAELKKIYRELVETKISGQR